MFTAPGTYSPYVKRRDVSIRINGLPTGNAAIIEWLGTNATVVATATKTLQDQLDRAVTNAFSLPFLLASALALAALVPVALGRGEPL